MSLTRWRELVKEADLRDAHCYAGIVLAGLGAGLLVPAAGLILVGAALFYLSVRGA